MKSEVGSLKVTRALQICGALWLFVGFILLRKGLLFAANLAQQTQEAPSSPLFAALVAIFSSSQWAAGSLMLVGMAIGLLKARHVLAKVALRNQQRLLELPSISWSQLFDRRFLFLMAGMMALGMAINALNMPIDLRAFIDLAVGTALIQGASTYFRASNGLSTAR